MSAVASEVLPAPEENLNPPNSDPNTAALASLPNKLPEVEAIPLPPEVTAAPAVSTARIECAHSQGGRLSA
jgi:hypothetical protein